MQWLPDTTAWIVEESVVDPRRERMQLITTNATLAYFMQVKETATMSPDPARYATRSPGCNPATSTWGRRE
jgi:hypothetical protein